MIINNYKKQSEWKMDLLFCQVQSRLNFSNPRLMQNAIWDKISTFSLEETKSVESYVKSLKKGFSLNKTKTIPDQIKIVILKLFILPLIELDRQNQTEPVEK